MTEHERSTRAVSEGITRYRAFRPTNRGGMEWCIAESSPKHTLGQETVVKCYPDAPGLDAATVLAMWEQEMEGRDGDSGEERGWDIDDHS